jgi:hypothetical protein
MKYTIKLMEDLELCILTLEWIVQAVVVLALPVPWVRFLRRPLTAIQTLTKKCKVCNEINIY